MRTINYISFLFITFLVIIACDSKTDLNPEADKNEDNIVSKFLRDVKSLESDTNTNPIVIFKELAEEMAEERMFVSKKTLKKY